MTWLYSIHTRNVKCVNYIVYSIIDGNTSGGRDGDRVLVVAAAAPRLRAASTEPSLEFHAEK